MLWGFMIKLLSKKKVTSVILSGINTNFSNISNDLHKHRVGMLSDDVLHHTEIALVEFITETFVSL